MNKIPGRLVEGVRELNTLMENNAVLSDTQIITVGGGIYDSFNNLVSAIESITDSSAENPYKIVIKPGIHVLSESVFLPAYVAIQGSGRHTSRLLMSGWSIMNLTTQNELSDLTIVGSDLLADGMLKFSSQRANGSKLYNLDMYLHGGVKACIHMANRNHTIYINNVNIITDSIGMVLRGYIYINACTIYLSGENTNTDYIGLLIPGQCRLYLHGSKIGTGYGSTAEPGYGEGLEVVGDPNSSVIGIHIPPDNTLTPRLQLHGFESFCRNAEATSKPLNGIHCVKAENGWVRMFGSFVQSEVPLFPPAQEALLATEPGTIEVYGTRYSSSAGNIVSRGQEAATTLSASDINLELENWDAGTKFCDATDGDIAISITPAWVSTPKGIKYTFIKTDSTANTVTITSPDLKILGGGGSITLSAQYDKITLMTMGGTGGLYEV